MGEVDAKRDIVTRQDRHAVSLLTDHLVLTSKYRGKVLEGEVAEAAEENRSLEKKALSKKQVFTA
jgi:REP element-mobilizing transposase RayT